jgi:hypothetical protein
MFERLFQYPRVLARHREGPMSLERERHLQHCADQGMSRASVIQQANELLVIVQRLDLAADDLITHEHIAAAATRWACYQRRRGRCRGLSSSSLICVMNGVWLLPRFTPVAGTQRSLFRCLRRRTARSLTPRSLMSISFWSPLGSEVGAGFLLSKARGRCVPFFVMLSVRVVQGWHRGGHYRTACISR